MTRVEWAITLCVLIRGFLLDNTKVDLIILENSLNFANLTSKLAEIGNMGLLKVAAFKSEDTREFYISNKNVPNHYPEQKI